MPTLYRPITEAEIPLVADLQARTYRTNAERYVNAYRGENSRFDWRDQRVLDAGEAEPVAALTFFQRPMSLNGGELPAGLVASVAVPPEQRRRGYGHQLMADLLNELYAQQTPISLLFPFSVGWYRTLGYGLANANWYLELPPRLLRDTVERRHVRRAGPDDESGMRACYDRARCLPRNNGWLSRGAWEWQNRVWKAEHDKVVYSVDGEVQGYLIYTLAWGTDAAPAKVVEWVCTTDAAWRGLAGFLAALGEQATVITYNGPQGDPLLAALPEPYSRDAPPAEFTFRTMARLVSGFMLRVVHLPAALTARRYPINLTADFVLRIHDSQLPANDTSLYVRVANGQVDVAMAAHHAAPSVETDIAAFSELYAGAISAEQARTAGRLAADDATCASLTALFAAAPLFMHQSDWF
jgi:predicted acetyltransferase